MAKISLSDFIDVVSKAGSPKATKVAQIKNRPAYEPSADFYRYFRLGLVDLHKAGGVKSDLANLQTGIVDPRKISNYAQVVAGYRKWWGKKQLTWFVPPANTYSHAGIDVSINPELGLAINGQPYVVKLYLKNDSLEKSKADMIVALMNQTLSALATDGIEYSVLDVRNSKLFSYNGSNKNFQGMVDAELAYISTLWTYV